MEIYVSYKEIIIKQPCSKFFYGKFLHYFRVSVMVLNATFNNISVISCRTVLLVEETGVPPEKTTELSQVTLSHNVVSSPPHLKSQL